MRRRTIPIPYHTGPFNISQSKHCSLWWITYLTVNVADVYKFLQKIRPGVALVVGKGAQQGQNRSGENEMTHSRQKTAATFNVWDVCYRLIACQLARVVRVHVCCYSLRA